MRSIIRTRLFLRVGPGRGTAFCGQYRFPHQYMISNDLTKRQGCSIRVLGTRMIILVGWMIIRVNNALHPSQEIHVPQFWNFNVKQLIWSSNAVAHSNPLPWTLVKPRFWMMEFRKHIGFAFFNFSTAVPNNLEVYHSCNIHVSRKCNVDRVINEDSESLR